MKGNNPYDDSEKLVLEIYGPLSDDIFVTPARKVFIYGGRGMGKSTLVKDLKIRIEDEARIAGREIVTIDPVAIEIIGRNWAQALEIIGQIHRLSRSTTPRQIPHCFLDDIDHLISMASILRGEKELAGVLRDMLRLISLFPPSRDGQMIVVTSTLPPIRFTEILYKHRTHSADAHLLHEAYSCFTQDFEYYQLNPWQEGWRDRLVEIINRYIGEGLNKSVLSSCQNVILELTGGHPSLFVSALVELRRISAGQSLRPIDQQFASILHSRSAPSDEKLEALLRRHLEKNYADAGLQPLRLTINSLRNSDRSDRQQAFELLVMLARRGGFVPPEELTPSIGTCKILQDEGLLYLDPEAGGYVIPGKLFLQMILQESEEDLLETETLEDGRVVQPLEIREKPADIIKLRIEPDPKSPSQRGRLIVQEGRKELALSGGPWSILKRLFEEPSKIFTLEELTIPPLRTEAAVRSAIQRLQANLTKEGLQGAIENVYGKGYRRGEITALRFL